MKMKVFPAGGLEASGVVTGITVGTFSAAVTAESAAVMAADAAGALLEAGGALLEVEEPALAGAVAPGDEELPQAAVSVSAAAATEKIVSARRAFFIEGDTNQPFEVAGPIADQRNLCRDDMLGIRVEAAVRLRRE